MKVDRAVHADRRRRRSATSSPSRTRRPGIGRGTARSRSSKADGEIWEYACHEGNYGVRNILNAARVEEAAARTLEKNGRTVRRVEPSKRFEAASCPVVRTSNSNVRTRSSGRAVRTLGDYRPWRTDPNGPTASSTRAPRTVRLRLSVGPAGQRAEGRPRRRPMAGLPRRRGQHGLFAARSDQPRHRAEAAGRLDLAVRQLRHRRADATRPRRRR